MSILFESVEINGMQVANRFVRSATNDRRANARGEVTNSLIQVYETLAANGVGLIFTGHAFVEIGGKAGATMLGCYDDSLIPGLRKLTDAVHRHGARIALQINHAGRRGTTSVIGRQPVAPSTVRHTITGEIPKALTGVQIEGLIEAFGAAAGRAVQAGFDGVQIHCAHGYLANQFLSPFTNRRIDSWGGSAEKRRRFLLAVYDEVRGIVGPGYPVMLKINASDYMENGVIVEESLEAVRILCDRDLDAVEISGGTAESDVIPSVRDIIEEPDEAYFRQNARIYKQAIQVPLMLVGGLRTPALMERILEVGDAEMVSLCRPLIREPDLVRRWLQGDRTRAACISCNGCQKFQDEPVRCILQK